MKPLPSSRLTLVLGGAASGKSAFAEGVVMEYPPPWHYFATADVLDSEMAEKVRVHQSRRDPRWITSEAPRDLAATLAGLTRPEQPVLIDCLTLWLSNVMLAGRETTRDGEALVAALTRAPGPVVVVSNETGLGIVPDNALARRFREAQGRLNQAVARAADRVVFVAAGLALTLKDTDHR
jgi:adenosylcobinamide kinase/adenosylcobinamide-phosphate guanylyltransferase